MNNLDEKIVLFGASLACDIYLSCVPTHENIVAILDNDPNKHGKRLLDIPILPAESVRDIEFDKIIITSKWDKEIFEQLTGEFAIPAHKISLSPKSITNRPFLSEENRNLGLSILIRINQYLIDRSIKAFLDFGTLLGLVRDGTLIPWDSDMDLSLNEPDYLSFLKVLPDLLNFDEQLKITFKPFIGGGALNISLRNDPDMVFYIDIFTRTVNEQAISIVKCITPTFDKIWYSPRLHFDSHEVIKIQGQDLYVPFKKYDYLALVYGDWKKPNPGFSLLDWKNAD